MDTGVESQAVMVLLVTLACLLAVLFVFFLLGLRREVKRGDTCPYCSSVLQFGSDVANSIQAHVNGYMETFSEEDNPQIDFSKAAICPTTGRIFTNCVLRGKVVSLDWSFLEKRSPGTYVSWGALPEDEKGIMGLVHLTLDGYQTKQSSTNIRPEKCEKEISLLSPGPLYVDRKTKILLGWVKVPGTDFEVLLVRRPQFQSIEETL